MYAKEKDTTHSYSTYFSIPVLRWAVRLKVEVGIYNNFMGKAKVGELSCRFHDFIQSDYFRWTGCLGSNQRDVSVKTGLVVGLLVSGYSESLCKES